MVIIARETKVKDGYKLTEVGVIPEDWEIKTISEIADVKGGKRLPLGKTLSNNPTPYPYIRVSDMFYGGVSPREIKYVPVDAFPSIKNYRISKDDIFITVAGTLGIVGKVPLELDGANLTENADKLINISCDRNYLLYMLMSSRIQNTIEAEKTIGAQPKLALNRIEKFQIALPTRNAEQQAIAAALSDIDALLEKLDMLIGKKHDIKQATMQQLLTGRTRLPGFNEELKQNYKRTEIGMIPDDWEIRKLGELTTLLTNGFVGKATDFYTDADDGVTYIQGFNVKENSYNLTGIKKVTLEFHKQHSKSSLLENDLLTVQTGEIGVTTIVPKDLEGSNCHALIISRFKKAFDAKYFSYYFNSFNGKARFKDIETGSTMKHLNVGDLCTLLVPFPPTKSEQTAIAAVLSDIDAEIAALEKKRDKTRALRQGMMQELLTGRIRLV